MNLSAQKDWRRQRLAHLMDEFGQRKLFEITGIAEAYLFQMSRGEGKHKRNVSDAMAAKIEEKIGRPGWFSVPHAPLPVEPKRTKAGSSDPDWTTKRTDKQESLVNLVLTLVPILDDAQCENVMHLLSLEAALSKEKKKHAEARRELAEAKRTIEAQKAIMAIAPTAPVMRSP